MIVVVAVFALTASAHADDGTYTSAAVAAPGAAASTAWIDVNRDKRADYCRLVVPGRPGQYACTLSTGRGFGDTVKTADGYDGGYSTPHLWGDVDGDGTPDFCRRTGDSGSQRVACTVSSGTALVEWPEGNATWGTAGTPAALVDANADGRLDYCRVVTDAGVCTLNTGKGWGADAPSLSLAANGLGQATGAAWTDVDGDRRADFCRVISASNAACTTAAGAQLNVNVGDTGPAAGRTWVDVDGDGKADFCRRWAAAAPTSMACTMGPDLRNTRLAILALGEDTGAAWADFDGDGDRDFCRVVSGKVACTPWSANGLDVPATVTSAALDVGAANDERAWVDFNGDGKADYCRRVGGAVACTTSTGTGFGFVPDPEPPVVEPDPTPTPAPAPSPSMPAGQPAAAPPAKLERIVVTLAFDYVARARSTRLRTLVVKGVPKGATVTVTCPKGCSSKRLVKTNAKTTVSLASLIRKPLKVGTVITVTVAKAGMLSAVKTLTIRARKSPLVRTR
jgi:hypothetical protein